MLPNANDLEYFLEVTKTLNISKASERMGVAQPTITQSIHKLESLLGAQLLIRTKTGVHLTKIGQKMSYQAALIYRHWNSMRREVQHDLYELHGKYTIGAHPAIAIFTLPIFFRELSRRAPNIEIDLIHDRSRNITEEIINFKIDFGFVVNPVKHPNLILKKICDDSVCLFEAKNERYSETIFGNLELKQTDWMLKQLNKSKFRYKNFVATPDLVVIYKLVNSGAGFGILPSLVVKTQSNNNLTLVDSILPSYKDQIFLAYRRETLSSNAAKLIAEICRNIVVYNP